MYSTHVLSVLSTNVLGLSLTCIVLRYFVLSCTGIAYYILFEVVTQSLLSTDCHILLKVMLTRRVCCIDLIGSNICIIASILGSELCVLCEGKVDKKRLHQWYKTQLLVSNRSSQGLKALDIREIVYKLWKVRHFEVVW